jgi:hypothetical protein
MRGYGVAMRIHDADGKALSAVHLALTDDEARELANDLADLLTAVPGWHSHISAADFQTGVTIYREDDPTAAF